MARTKIEIKFLGTPDFVLDTMIDYPRKYIRHVFRSFGETIDVTDKCSADDLNRSAEITNLRDASRAGGPLIDVIVTPGDSDVDGAGFGNGPDPSDTAPEDTAATADAGVASTYSRSDHAHVTGDATITPAKFSVADADLIGGLLVLRKALTASGATGAADDVTVIASLPFKVRIIDAFMLTSTAAAGSSTAALRTATAGGGTKLTGDMATDAAGISRPAGTTPTSTSTVAAAGALYLRRSDRAQVGTLFVYMVRES